MSNPAFVKAIQAAFDDYIASAESKRAHIIALTELFGKDCAADPAVAKILGQINKTTTGAKKPRAKRIPDDDKRCVHMNTNKDGSTEQCPHAGKPEYAHEDELYCYYHTPKPEIANKRTADRAAALRAAQAKKMEAKPPAPKDESEGESEEKAEDKAPQDPPPKDDTTEGEDEEEEGDDDGYDITFPMPDGTTPEGLAWDNTNNVIYNKQSGATFLTTKQVNMKDKKHGLNGPCIQTEIEEVTHVYTYVPSDDKQSVIFTYKGRLDKDGNFVPPAAAASASGKGRGKK